MRPARPSAQLRRRVLFVALSVCCACVKRIAPSAGEDRTSLSGVSQKFGSDEQAPQGTKVSWDFGDGTPPASGVHVEHAFPRAGAFTVTQIVADKDGQERRASAHVTVLRRSVPMAVPADARAALILQYPWGRIALHRQVAARLALSGLFEETARAFNEALGFDSLDPQAALANGFDTDEGFALFTVPQDPEALIVAVGVNPSKAMLFDVEERVELARRVVAPYANVRVEAFDGLAVQYVRKVGARVILRGVRSLTDMEYEFSMTLTNARLAPEVETVFLMADGEYSHVSSSLIKQIAQHGGEADLERFVPAELIGPIMAKMRGLLGDR